MELARKALEANNEEDARKALAEHHNKEEDKLNLLSAYSVAKENADMMRDMYNKLVQDINLLDSRRATLKAKNAIAKTQERMNAMQSMKPGKGVTEAFDDIEAKIDARLDKARAESELGAAPVSDLDQLKEKYSTSSTSLSVEEKLAQLKAEMQSN